MTTMIPEQFTESLKKALGEALHSVALYGSAAKGDRSKRFSDYNVLILLKDTDLSTLRAAQPAVGKWVKAGNPPPVLFTEKRFQEAADIFPIEFMDMKASHQILFGRDPFAELAIHTVHLRHELEYELQSKLIQLRQRYLTSQAKPKRLQELLAKSISSFAVLFKTVLSLVKDEAPLHKKDIFEALNRHVAIDAEALEIILKIRDGDPSALRYDPENLFGRLLRSIEAVVDFLNRYGKDD